jgi:hypothetical protein
MRKFFAYPVMVLSACGILCCLLLAGMIVRGNHAIEKVAPTLLFPGIFVVWFPTILVMNGLTRDFKQMDLWKAALRGCPSWMRTILWITAGLIFFCRVRPALPSGEKSRRISRKLRVLSNYFLCSLVLRNVLSNPRR